MDQEKFGSFRVNLLMRHGTAVTRLLSELSQSGEDCDARLARMIADDAADYVWACLIARTADEGVPIRAVRNDVAEAVFEILQGRGFADPERL